MSATIQQQLDWASKILYSISCSARLDSEILLAFCLNKNRAFLMTWPERELSEQQIECFQGLVRRRLLPQPIAYLTGSREFYSLELMVTEATLVPRPETEMLVEQVLTLIQGCEHAQILELGTGTGAIALAVKKHAARSTIIATDVSRQALEVARENAINQKLDIQFLLSDWYRDIPRKTHFDVIVSNPPYIAAADPYLRQGDLPAEPRLALSSGASGLEALQIIIQEAGLYLKKEGWIVLEHGYEQASAVKELLLKNRFSQIKQFKDFNDLDRLSMASYNP
jgi:release factor glutamine methyltransferase